MKTRVRRYMNDEIHVGIKGKSSVVNKIRDFNEGLWCVIYTSTRVSDQMKSLVCDIGSVVDACRLNNCPANKASAQRLFGQIE